MSTQKNVMIKDKVAVKKLDALFIEYLEKHGKKISYGDILSKLLLKSDFKDIDK